MKIYIFMNGGRGTDWINGMALAEDGTYLAGHISSNEGWFRHDMGLTSDWKHEVYNEYCPNGYELVEVENPRDHKGLQAAYKLNQEKKVVEQPEPRS